MNKKQDVFGKDVISDKQIESMLKQLGLGKKKYNYDQIRMGIGVELEHGIEGGDNINVTNNNLITTLQIVLAHLNEISDYYTRLKEIEKVKVNESIEFDDEGDVVKMSYDDVKQLIAISRKVAFKGALLTIFRKFLDNDSVCYYLRTHYHATDDDMAFKLLLAMSSEGLYVNRGVNGIANSEYNIKMLLDKYKELKYPSDSNQDEEESDDSDIGNLEKLINASNIYVGKYTTGIERIKHKDFVVTQVVPYFRFTEINIHATKIQPLISKGHIRIDEREGIHRFLTLNATFALETLEIMSLRESIELKEWKRGIPHREVGVRTWLDAPVYCEKTLKLEDIKDAGCRGLFLFSTSFFRQPILLLVVVDYEEGSFRDDSGFSNKKWDNYVREIKGAFPDMIKSDVIVAGVKKDVNYWNNIFINPNFFKE